jgi:hypothetical protein
MTNFFYILLQKSTRFHAKQPHFEERSIAKSKLAEGTLRDPDPVMPRLDKNGLMAGSAERCENRTEQVSWHG